MERYICIHGHFYQPPRENPSLEAVEVQDSAYPYHDWNERITAECYGPNASSRILDGQGRIEKIVNNYARISFNFGPTLLAWMQDKAPDVYQSILAADQDSLQRFSGHGSALAQAYNHMILPLANDRDRRTQVLWGIHDFQHRFGRSPEGMWLPETAANAATLDLLAELGLRFTLLAPHQAKRVRRIGSHHWRDVSGGQIDPTRAYRAHLPSGRSIALFFYDGPVSRAVAFEGLLNRGENLANRLLSAFSNSRSWPQLAHIATDGESYGHHHRHGDMALAYALDHLQAQGTARLTNYGEFLEKHPPTHEVEILENSSWSCAHGIERWRSDCGCNSGGYPDWNQQWRGPLRAAYDWLRDALAPAYESGAGRLLRDPWAARDDYISVVLDRSRENVEGFLSRHASRELGETDRIRALKLLEMQRHTLLMYTSCGWFFDELSGLESVQTLQYAGRALQLAQEALDQSLEPAFLDLLEKARSNLPQHQDGRHIYQKWVKPSLAGLEQVGAHYALSSLFAEECQEGEQRVYCYSVQPEDCRHRSAGKVRLALGRATITSRVTRESKKVSFGVLHLGDHNLAGGVREFQEEAAHQELTQAIDQAFARGDLTELIRAVDRSFGSHSYSLKLLFKDQQRQILKTVLDSTLAEAEALYRQVYEHHAPTMRFLADLEAPLPRAWNAAAELVINGRLRTAFQGEDLEVGNVRSLLEEARQWQVTLDGQGLAYLLRQRLEGMAQELIARPEEPARLQKLETALELVRSLPFEVDLWKVQNCYFGMLQRVPSMFRDRTRRSHETAETWLHHFASLGEKLGIRVGEMIEEQIARVPTLEAAVQEVAAHRRLPTATYRLQFNRGLTFQDARALASYLHDLGISDLYASPLLQARPNSSHGYDLCDPSRINPNLGTEEDFEAFCGELRARGMGLVLDMVPNHMGIGDHTNRWWMDVLENGPSSVYASYFDIDWDPAKPELQNKVLLPILEDQYGRVLESGKLRLAYEEGAFFIYYYETKLPVAPRSYIHILSFQLDTLAQALGEGNDQVRELRSILTALSYLPPRTELAPEKIAERNREKEIIKARIASLYRASPYLRAAIDTAVQAFNGVPGDRRSFDLLHRTLDDQAYRPAYWRVAGEEINYRRFFDINDLAAIRVELPEVFHATHELVLRWLAEGKVTGLRIDHADGLWNPRAYLWQLQESYLRARIAGQPEGEEDGGDLDKTISSWLTRRVEKPGSPAPAWPLYVVAEKILAESERLPEDWAVEGTTGYDFLNALNGIFVHGGHRQAFDRIYSRFVGSATSFQNLVNSTKKMIMLVSLASEVHALGHHMERIAEKNRLYRDFTLNSLTFALREVIAALPVYRTYITGPGAVGQQDEAYLRSAVNEAKKRNPRTATAIFDFVEDTLLLRNLEEFDPEDRRALLQVVMKIQQVTGPVMAKGVEDTAFYVYNRLVSLNEVGGHPEQFGTAVAAFHHQNAERQRRWPHSLLATSTHDTKRSEDVRARIDVLSEIPEEWRAALDRWSQLNASKKTRIDGDPAPDPNDEYLLYQTLLGAWPESAEDAETRGHGDAEIGVPRVPASPRPRVSLAPEEMASFRDRIAAYMQKATKEAKVHTSWVNANEPYDVAVQQFVHGILPDGEDDPFLTDFRALQHRVAYFGRFSALSQTLLKLTAPGVPDLYQGTELWDLSLVDPDNRRPVDFQRRRSLLAELKSRLEELNGDPRTLAGQLLETPQDGHLKLFLTYRTLGLRREHQRLFSEGDYLPLAAHGKKREHLCAFARVLGEEAALVVAPRLVVGLTEGVERPPLGPEVWEDTRLVLPRPLLGASFRNLFTGEVLSAGRHEEAAGLPLAALLASFPVALLVRNPE